MLRFNWFKFTFYAITVSFLLLITTVVVIAQRRHPGKAAMDVSSLHTIRYEAAHGDSWRE